MRSRQRDVGDVIEIGALTTPSGSARGALAQSWVITSRDRGAQHRQPVAGSSSRSAAWRCGYAWRSEISACGARPRTTRREGGNLQSPAHYLAARFELGLRLFEHHSTCSACATRRRPVSVSAHPAPPLLEQRAAHFALEFRELLRDRGGRDVQESAAARIDPLAATAWSARSRSTLSM